MKLGNPMQLDLRIISPQKQCDYRLSKGCLIMHLKMLLVATLRWKTHVGRLAIVSATSTSIMFADTKCLREKNEGSCRAYVKEVAKSKRMELS